MAASAGGHAHELVSYDDCGAVVIRGADGLEAGKRRGREAHVLFVLPQMLVHVRADAELVEHPGLELVYRPQLNPPDVYQDDLRELRTPESGSKNVLRPYTIPDV